MNISYPLGSREQDSIFNQVKYWTRNADAIIPGFLFADGLGRWDVFLPSPLSLEIESWGKSNRNQIENGISGEVVIAHAPNHRGFKGTEFIIDAVEKLQNKGFKIKFLLLENKRNTEIKRILNEEVDILVDQLIYTGYSLNTNRRDGIWINYYMQSGR